MRVDRSQIGKDIEKYLKSNGVMTLAVSSDKKPWVCTVYYGSDKKMNLYIVTDPDSKHGKIFSENTCVAFNIFDSHQKITKPKIGLQGTGKIELIKGAILTAKALIIWHKANPGIEKKIGIKDILKKLTDTKVYKVIPIYLKYFNQPLYGSKEYAELHLK